SDIALSIRGDAAHPAIDSIGGVIQLLLHGCRINRPTRNIDLCPLRSGRSCGGTGEGVGHPQRFSEIESPADSTILVLLHKLSPAAVEQSGGIGLRDDIPASYGITVLAAHGVRRTERAAAPPAVRPRREFTTSE